MTYAEFIAIPKEWRRLMRDTDRVKYLREVVTSLPPMQTNGRVQSGNLNRSMAMADALIDAEREIFERTEAMRVKEAEALLMIDGIQGPTKRVLYLHYCRHLSISDIATIIYYTPRYCYMLRKKGLAIIRERGEADGEQK